MNEKAAPEASRSTLVASRRVMAFTAIVIGLVSIAGVAFRLEDPLSDGIIPAEDPYTHMALVREHLSDGELDPLYDTGSLYPPGMHLYLGTVWVFTGLELYDIMLVGPAVLGGIGIIGIGLLAGRLGGPVAGALAAMAYAVAPETIFRTSMMSPTALDLAILPYLLLAFMEVVRGRYAWLAAAAPIAIFLVWSHPWALVLLGAAGAVLAVLITAVPWPERSGQAPPRARGAAIAVALFGYVLALATWVRNGFGTVFSEPLGISTGPLVLVLLILSLAPLALVATLPRVARAFDAPRRTHHVAWRIGLSVALLVALAAITYVAAQGGFPRHVDLPRMFGWPILGLAAAGFVLAPFARGPLSYLGTSLAAATYPFVVFNPLNSAFWPHRTAVFFGIGAVLLVGVATSLIVQGVRWLGHAYVRRSEQKTQKRVSHWRVHAATLTVAALLSVTVVGASPASYPDGWYRLYAECEMDALRDIADVYNEHPDAVIVTGTWQSKLVLGAFVEDNDDLWFKPGLYTSDDEREKNLRHWEKAGTMAIVVVDPHHREELPIGATDFLQHEPWSPHNEYCRGMGGMDQPRVITYTFQEEVA